MKPLKFDISKSRPKTKAQGQITSDKYSDNAKEFLDHIHIHESKCKKSTRLIISKFLQDFRFPLPGEQLRIRTQQQMNLIAILMKAVAVFETIEECTIATYTMNKEAFGILQDFLKGGQIKKLTLYIASSYNFREKEYSGEMKRTCLALSKNYDVSLIFAWLHFKITLFRCGQNYFLHEGSMNYSTNNMAEQFLFENNKESYLADYEFLETHLKGRENKALEIIC